MRRIEIAAILAVLFLAVAALPALASPTFTTLYSFNGTDGDAPLDSLIQGTDGNLYGTTQAGGSDFFGEVFSIDTGGTTLTPVLAVDNMSSPYGLSFQAGVIQGSDGNLYGMVTLGGANSQGTVFKVAPGGSGYTDLYDFGGTAGDGEQPYGGLVQGSDGNFYGTTFKGGANGDGTIFEISPSGGGITILHSFGSGSSDLQSPEAGLIEGQNGSLFGTADGGGPTDNGGVFRINLDGSGYSILHIFEGAPSDGANPFAGLVEGGDGFLYGTTGGGGPDYDGTVFKIAPDGTGYQMLYSFAGAPADGMFPTAALALGNDEKLYGTTQYGGPNGTGNNDGSLFDISRNGSEYDVLHFFDGADGNYPRGGLLQATNGIFYGTTYLGGANSSGSIFSLDNGLSASPAGVYVLSGDGNVQVNWNADTLADPSAGYKLYRSTTPGGEGSTPYQSGITNLFYNDPSAANGTTYYYQVTAITPDGTETAKSYEVTGTPQMTIASSDGLSATPNPATGGKTTTGTLSLTEATTGPTTAFVSSDNPNVTFASPDITVPAAQGSTEFNINTANTGSSYTADITASENGTDATTTITVNAPSVLHTFSPNLQMISGPTDDTAETLSNVFANSATDLAVYSASTGLYKTTPTAPANTIIPGQGYWIHPASTATMYDIGTDTSTTNSYQIALSTGWNMVGDAFSAPVSVTALQVKSGTHTYTFANGNLNGLVADTFYTYQAGDTSYEVLPASSTSLQPFEGYWLYAFAPCTLIFQAFP